MTKHELIAWTCMRSAGVGLSMMSMMTGGISSLRTDLTTSGSAINTVAQRVSAALGLAGLTAMATIQQAQLSDGRGALLDGAHAAAARLSYVQMYGVYRQTQLAVLADSYSNVFLVTGVLTVVAAGGALFLRSGPADHSGPKPAVHAE